MASFKFSFTGVEHIEYGGLCVVSERPGEEVNNLHVMGDVAKFFIMGRDSNRSKSLTLYDQDFRIFEAKERL